MSSAPPSRVKGARGQSDTRRVLTRTFAVCAGAVLALAATAVGAVAFAGQGTWDPAVFAALLFLVVGATLVEIEFKKVAISCDFLGLIVAMALLGPTQAAIL